MRTAKAPPIWRALASAQAYGMLARAFARPDPGFESEVRSGAFGAGLEEAFAALTCRELAGRTKGLGRRVIKNGLSPLFQRLFNPSVDANCPPYETEYTGVHVFMRSQQLADVAGFYRAFGLRVAGDFHDRPDHIAAELEFMQVLALQEARALARSERENASVCRKARARFLKEHLGRWLSAYAERVSQVFEPNFYTELVALVRDLAAWDARQLGVEPQVVALRRRRSREPEVVCPAPAGGEADVQH